MAKRASLDDVMKFTSPKARSDDPGPEVPTIGVAPAMFDPTVIAQMASWSHGKRYPVKLINIVKTRSTTPIAQLNSRGGL